MAIKIYSNGQWRDIKTLWRTYYAGWFVPIKKVTVYKSGQWREVYAEVQVSPTASPTGTWVNYANLNVSGYTVIDSNPASSATYEGNLNFASQTTSQADLYYSFGYQTDRYWNTIDSGFTGAQLLISLDGGTTKTAINTISNSLNNNNSTIVGEGALQSYPIPDGTNLADVKLYIQTGTSYYYDYDGEFNGMAEYRLFKAHILYLE